jgi:protein-disulfide isomerase
MDGEIMDISNINAKEVGIKYGFKIGEATAPVKVIEFINLRCPYCAKWFDDSKEVLDKYVQEGKVQRIIKHFDKESSGLITGNMVHHFLDYRTPEKALEEIRFLFTHQNEWGRLNNQEEIKNYVESERGLFYKPNVNEINGIILEATNANVTLVPSVFIGEEIFDEHITTEELTNLIETELTKKK